MRNRGVGSLGGKSIDDTLIFYADRFHPEGGLYTAQQMVENGMVSRHQNHLSQYGTGAFDGGRVLSRVRNVDVLQSPEAQVRYLRETPMPTANKVQLFGITFREHLQRQIQSASYLLIANPEQDPTGMYREVEAFLMGRGRDIQPREKFIFADLDLDFLIQAALKTIKANVLLGIQTEGGKGVDPRMGGYFRPLVFRSNRYDKKGKRMLDYGVYSLEHNWAMTITFVEWGKYLPERNVVMLYPTPVQAEGRNHKLVPNYGYGGRPKNLAMRFGYSEAILHDPDGNVLEGTGENIFVKKDGVFSTPPLSLSILPGTKRQIVLEMAKALDIEIVEESFDLEFLMKCDAAFFTGTAAGVAPIEKIENPFSGIENPKYKHCTPLPAEHTFDMHDPDILKLQEQYQYLIYGDDRLLPKLKPLQEKVRVRLPMEEIVIDEQLIEAFLHPPTGRAVLSLT
ncbi:aminotransferase class IV family protein [Candidatus Woesearchaeota archaeon]|nr:aminotransferase class IV family protein [Candidatus Woesearchaeota archaeon]